MHTLLDIFAPFSLEEQSVSLEDCKIQNDVHVAVQEIKEICFCPWVKSEIFSNEIFRDKARKCGKDTINQKPTFLSFLLLSWAEMWLFFKL